MSGVTCAVRGGSALFPRLPCASMSAVSTFISAI
jgi:hypothetical protein